GGAGNRHRHPVARATGLSGQLAGGHVMDTSGFLIDAGWVVTPNDAGGVDVMTGVIVAVRGTRIEYVGPEAGLPEPLRALERVDAREAVVIPGFVNAHNHAAMTLLRSYADDLPLMQWLQ